MAFFHSGFIAFCKESYSTLRWYFYYGWKMSAICLYHKGRETQKKYGISLFKQFTSLINLSLLHNITPVKYYKYRFYLTENRGKELDYFYTFELPHFHIVSNKGNQHLDKARKFIADKTSFTEALKKFDIPHVPTILNTSNVKNPDISIFFREEDIFCKPNNGSQSKDAFRVRYIREENRYELHPINGNPVTCSTEVAAFLKEKLKSCNDLILQHFIRDHSEIKALADSEQSITLRIITAQFNDRSVKPVYMQLEIPDIQKNSKQFYKIYPLTLKTFEVTPIFKSMGLTENIKDPHLSDSIKLMLSQSLDLCVYAHSKLIALKSVAFDLFITNEGPLIIEANFNWDIEMLYNHPHKNLRELLPEEWLKNKNNANTTLTKKIEN